MPRDPRVYLLDAITAGQLIERFVAGKTLDDYLSDAMLHSAVERQFEIIGEALRQLATAAPGVADSIQSVKRIIAFRNQLAHGYFAVQRDVVWVVATRDLPLLVRQLREILGAGGSDG